MFRLLIFLGLSVFISVSDTLPVNTWRPVLEQKLDGCPCKVQMGGRATQMSRIATEILSREEYNKWVANGRPDRISKFPSIANMATFGNVSEPLVPKHFCFTDEESLHGDFNIVIFCEGECSVKVVVEDVARGQCDSKSIYDYGDSGGRDECKVSELDSGSKRFLTPASRIFHGRLVLEKEIAAYNVKITDLEVDENSDLESCTGSLIAPRFVLTAAHCGVKKGQHVYIGEYLNIPGEKHTVADVITHKEYDEPKTKDGRIGTEKHDIQLLYLDAPVKNAEQRMVTLNADCHRPVSCRHALVSGYGESAEDECKEDVLRSTIVNIISHDKCHELLKKAHEGLAEFCLDESPHFCATHDLCGTGICDGDSGGPLVVADKETNELVQIGISSYTVGDCGDRDHPDIYTRVSEYKEWIYIHSNRTAKFNPPLGVRHTSDCPVRRISGQCETDGQNHIIHTEGDDGKGARKKCGHPKC